MNDTRPPGPLDRLLGIFGDVRAGEGATVLLISLNVFLLLVGYYVLKTVREPLILMAGGAESQLMGLQRSKAALVQTILRSARNIGF